MIVMSTLSLRLSFREEATSTPINELPMMMTLFILSLLMIPWILFKLSMSLIVIRFFGKLSLLIGPLLVL